MKVLLINPSLFEGWSSTVEEAKSLGKNIILSDISVHKEQNPDEATFFARDDYKELAEILKFNWENKPAKPNYKLEEKARKTIVSRMKAFGEKYINIIRELI